MASNRNTLFRNVNSDVGSGSHRYNSQLKKLFEGVMKAILPQFIRPDHANSHGTRKGAGVEATSGTTCPPPIPSVAARGEWSMGKVFDVYWTFAHAGDQYLGRILAGLDPNSANFACIPPHFEEGLENSDINEAMNLCFKNIMDKNAEELPNIIGILLRFLACMVHHSDYLITTIISKNPANKLNQIPIFTDKDLLDRLKKLVSTKATSKIPKASGIPPHTKQIVLMSDLINEFAKEREERSNLFDKMSEIVSEKLEKIAADNGSLTRSAVKNMFEDEFGIFKTAMSTEISTSVAKSLSVLSLPPALNSLGSVGEEQQNNGEAWANGAYKVYSYSGRFFSVPKNFAFPSDVKRQRAWTLWLKGMDFLTKDPVRPFRLLKASMLPTSDLKKQFTNEWKPIMSKMEMTPRLIIPDDPKAITSSFLQSSYDAATLHLKTNVCSFIWTNKSNHEAWTVGSWSTKTAPNKIRKFGAETDKSNLPRETHHNRPHARKRTLVHTNNPSSIRVPNLLRH